MKVKDMTIRSLESRIVLAEGLLGLNRDYLKRSIDMEDDEHWTSIVKESKLELKRRQPIVNGI